MRTIDDLAEKKTPPPPKVAPMRNDPVPERVTKEGPPRPIPLTDPRRAPHRHTVPARRR